MHVDLLGEGLYSSPLAADPDFTQTIRVDVREAWVFAPVAGAGWLWMRELRNGFATELLGKDLPDWQETTFTKYRIWSDGEGKEALTQKLHKRQVTADEEQHESHEWTEFYQPQTNSVIAKIGDDFMSKADLQISVNGTFKSSTERHTWTGPVLWTEEVKSRDRSRYANGKIVGVEADDSRHVREFASNLAVVTFHEVIQKGRTLQDWYPQSNRKKDELWELTQTERWTFGFVSTLDELSWSHGTVWYDNEAHVVSSDNRRFSATEGIEIAGVPQPSVLVESFFRHTSYRSNGTPESLESEHSVPAAAGASWVFSLEWDNNSQLTMASVGGVALVVPLDDAAKKELRALYGRSFRTESDLFWGYVPEWAYPGLGF